MEDILGLLILVMPLPVFILIGIGFLAIVLLVHKFKKTGRRWGVGLLAGFAFLLIFTWDVILGNAYFYYLCATEGGIKVYEQAELPAEYWREDGLPKTSAAEIKGFRTRIGENFYLKVIEENDYIPLLNIDRQEDSLINIESDEIVAKMTHFRYWGGWLIANSGLHQSAASCPGKGTYVNFYKRVFVIGK